VRNDRRHAFSKFGMTLDNLVLFELMTAGSHASEVTLALASLLARMAVWSLPIAAALAWLHGDRRLRVDLLCVLLSVAVAYAVILVIRTSVCVPGLAVASMTAFGECWMGPGSPNAQVAVWWSVALALVPFGRLAWMSFPLLTVGLGVGWSLVYLGRAFPLDVLSAFPAAAAGALVTWALRAVVRPACHRLVRRSLALTSWHHA
jgi:membrane-associated phospholipid phosphatase